MHAIRIVTAADVPKLVIPEPEPEPGRVKTVTVNPGKQVILDKKNKLNKRREENQLKKRLEENRLELQNTKVQDALIPYLQQPSYSSDALWNAVLRRLRVDGIGVDARGCASLLPGAHLQTSVEEAIKTAAKTLSLVAALNLPDSLACYLLPKAMGDTLWKAAVCADVKGGGIVNFRPDTDATVLENLVGELVKAGEFKAACMIVRGCPESQIAHLMHMVLEGVMAKMNQKTFDNFTKGLKCAGMRLVLNHRQFVDLMSKCSKETKEFLIDAIVDRYDKALKINPPKKTKEFDWDHAAALCRLMCALLKVGDAETALMFIDGVHLHPRMGGEILRILETDVAAGKTTLATVKKLEIGLRKVQAVAWADSVRAIRLKFFEG